MKPLRWTLFVLPAGWVTLVGCGEHSTPPPKAAVEIAVAAPVAEVAAQADGEPWGDITGRIVWGGDKVPPQVNLNLGANPDAGACQKDGPVKDDAWLVNPTNKGMKNVFVWLEGAKKGDKLPIHADLKKVAPAKVEIDQPACAFVPHAVALREGQILVVKNSSGIGHNIRWIGSPTANPGGNELLPPGTPKEIDNLKADRNPVSFECNIHPWMRGWGRVFDHPYYAVTDADGNFAIKNAPAGEFRIKAWYGASGWLGGAKGKDGEPITVKSGQNKLGDKPFPPPAD